MKKIKLLLVCISLISFANIFAAGRTGTAYIKHVIVKPNKTEIWMVNNFSTPSNCVAQNFFILEHDHPAYDQLFSGFLAASLSNTRVDIVGDGTCNNGVERIHWGYVNQNAHLL